MNEDNVINFWLEQSKLMWGRVQTISAVEAGSLSGWFVIYKDHQLLATGLLVLATLLLVLLALLMRRDADYMAACESEYPSLIPKPLVKPFCDLRGRDIAFGIPLMLAICNILPLVATWAC